MIKRKGLRQLMSTESNGTLPLSFESPDSSLIASGRYDPDTRTLTLTFTSGKSYTYSVVTPEMWEALCMAASKGKVFNTQIQPFVAGRSVE